MKLKKILFALGSIVVLHFSLQILTTLLGRVDYGSTSVSLGLLAYKVILIGLGIWIARHIKVPIKAGFKILALTHILSFLVTNFINPRFLLNQDLFWLPQGIYWVGLGIAVIFFIREIYAGGKGELLSFEEGIAQIEDAPDDIQSSQSPKGDIRDIVADIRGTRSQTNDE